MTAKQIQCPSCNPVLGLDAPASPGATITCPSCGKSSVLNDSTAIAEDLPQVIIPPRQRPLDLERRRPAASSSSGTGLILILGIGAVALVLLLVCSGVLIVGLFLLAPRERTVSPGPVAAAAAKDEPAVVAARAEVGEVKANRVRIVNEAAGCEIVFPARPRENDLVGKGYTLERGPGKVLMFIVNPLQERMDFGDPKPGQESLGATLDFMVENQLFKLRSQKKFLVGRHPARDADLDDPNGNLFRMRLILTPLATIQITVVGPAAYQNSPEAKQFLESFKLKD